MSTFLESALDASAGAPADWSFAALSLSLLPPFATRCGFMPIGDDFLGLCLSSIFFLSLSRDDNFDCAGTGEGESGKERIDLFNNTKLSLQISWFGCKNE